LAGAAGLAGAVVVFFSVWADADKATAKRRVKINVINRTL
jgi:hypothetical protein